MKTNKNGVYFSKSYLIFESDLCNCYSKDCICILDYFNKYDDKLVTQSPLITVCILLDHAA